MQYHRLFVWSVAIGGILMLSLTHTTMLCSQYTAAVNTNCHMMTTHK